MVRKLLPLILILALGLTACGFSFELPSVTPGATLVDPISVTQAEDTTTPTHLVLSFGAGKLNLAPGADGLVTGTASYNVVDFKPEITNTGNTVNITQGNYTLNKIPNFGKVINTWDLKLGTTPIDLEISAGAYKASLELGDLALTNLTVKDGASDVDLVFTNPNHTEMNLLRYETGASQVSLKGLSYANFSMLEFKGGAGNYSLDFSGELSQHQYRPRQPDTRHSGWSASSDDDRWKPGEHQHRRRLDQEREHVHPGRDRPNADHCSGDRCGQPGRHQSIGLQFQQQDHNTFIPFGFV
jgi:hypothetical protein